MKLNEIGEFGLIRRFAPLFVPPPSLGMEGIGDDCAIIPQDDKHSFLITTDLLLESVHFLKTTLAAEDLGYKTLAVSLSDIAAMGGKPLYAFLSMGLPADIEVEWIDQFFKGLHELAQAEQVLLLGGDTSRSSNGLVLNCLVMGSMLTAHIKRRSQAKLNDWICCTGYLGDAGAGLKILLQKLPQNAITKPLIQQHVRPRPHLKEGEWLAQQAGVHAMMDISDGLDADVRHIMEQSHCGARIDLETLPLSPSLRDSAQAFGWEATEMAATAGEDYCLLVTIDPQSYASLNQAYTALFDRPLFKVGEITSGSSLAYFKNGQPAQLAQAGFDHFL